MTTTAVLWGGFTLLVLVLLALDLGVLNRGAAVIPPRRAAMLTGLWVALAVAFGLGILFWRGSGPALEFFTGYLLEYSLSMDNIFVFVLLFSYFAVPAAYQRRVLFWGVLGALIMRAVMIVVGAALIERFSWVLYLFGAFLIVSGIRMARQREEEVHPEGNPLIGLVRRILPVTDEYAEDRFFVRRGGRLMATPLFIVLLTIESTDLVFAVDSIPAIFGVTTDAFIVYSSNVFAILGLRSLYFILADAVTRLYYLRLGLAAILVFVGLKMIAERWVHLPVAVSLLAIVACLGLAGAASVVRNRRLAARDQAPPAIPGQLSEVTRTELRPDEAFGCGRRVRQDGAATGDGARGGLATPREIEK